MGNWSGYLSTETRKALANALIDSGLASRKSVEILLDGLPRKYLASLREAGDLQGSMRLTMDLNDINRTSALVSGEVPMRVLLSNAASMVQDQQSLQAIDAALHEMDSNPPSLSTAKAATKIATESKSHSRFDAFANRPGRQAAPDSTASAGPIEPELNIGRDEKLPINFAQNATIAANSVFKVIVHRHFDGIPGADDDVGHGTAWVLGPGIGITNHHVFEARDHRFEDSASEQDYSLQISTARMVADFFDAEDPQQGITLGDDALLAANAQLDYAIFRLPQSLATRAVLARVNAPLRKSAAAPPRSRVNIIQHPHGLPMKLAIRNNYIMSGDEEQLTYLTDTDGGSSGSPVMNDQWQVAALHIGARENEALDFTLLGRPIKHENIGVAIGAVLDDIKLQAPQVHQQIVAGHA